MSVHAPVLSRVRAGWWAVPVGAATIGGAVLLATGAPGGFLAILAAVSVAGAALWCRWDSTSIVSLALFVAMVLPSNLVVRPLGGVATPANLIGLLGLALWLLGRLGPDTQLAVGRSPVRAVLWIFLAACTLSWLWMNTSAITIPIENSAANRGMLTMFSGAGIALLCIDGIQSWSRMFDLVRKVVGGAAMAAGIGVITFFSKVDMAAHVHFPGLTAIARQTEPNRGGFLRVSSTMAHPIEFGVVMAAVLPLAVLLAVHEGRRRPAWWGAVGLIAAAIFMSVSRSGMLALAVVTLFVVPTWTRRQRRFGALLGVGFLGALKVTTPGLVGTVRALFTNASRDPSVAHRKQDYQAIEHYVSHAGLVGRGIHTFLPKSYRYVDNQYLLSLVEMGLIGLVSLAILFAVSALTAAAAYSSLAAEERVERQLVATLGGGLLGIATTFYTFDTLSFPTVTLVVFMIMGCCGAAFRLTKPYPAWQESAPTSGAQARV